MNIELPPELDRFRELLEKSGDEPISLIKSEDPRLTGTVMIRPRPFAESRVRYWLEAEDENHRQQLEKELEDTLRAWKSLQ